MAVFSAILLISLNVIATPKKVACAKAAYNNTAVVMVSPAPDVSFNCITPAAKASPRVENATAYTGQPKDRKAIKGWQKKNGLHPDGNWGPASAAKFAAMKDAATKKDASSNFNNSSGIQKADVSNTTSNCGKNSVNNDTGQANKNLVNTQLSVAETVMPDVVQLK